MEEKALAESLSETGNLLKAVGTVVSVVGALLMAVGFLIRYFSEKK